MNGRLYYLDAVGGILLIHMIIGHCCQWSQTFSVYQTWTYWLDFFMPWFFFKAGMFFKQRPVKDELGKSFRRLIIPYIYFSIIGTGLLWIKLCINGELSLRDFLSPFRSILIAGSTPGNLALWFLLSLFVIKLAFSAIHIKLSSAGNLLAKCLCGGVLGVLCIIFIPVHYVLELNNITYPLWLSNISSGMLFFTTGYLLRDFKPNKIFKLILLVGYVLVMVFYPTVVGMRSGDLICGEYLLWIPTAVLGILTFNNIFYLLFKKKNLLSVIGAQTMPYYCMHWCVIVIVSIFFITEPGIPDIPFFIALIIANIIILPTATYLINRSRFSYIIK